VAQIAISQMVNAEKLGQILHQVHQTISGTVTELGTQHGTTQQQTKLQ
jgi:hypothetical protein